MVTISGENASYVREFHEGKGYKGEFLGSTILPLTIKNENIYTKSELNIRLDTFCEGAQNMEYGAGWIKVGFEGTIGSAGIGAFVTIGMMYYGATQVTVGV